MAADKLTQLADELDTEEQCFRAAWPHRPLWHLGFAGRTIERAYDDYRAAMRAEVTERPSSAWCQRIAATLFPDPLTSLRQIIEEEAQRILSSRAIRANRDWDDQRREHREVVVRHYPRRKPRIRRF